MALESELATFRDLLPTLLPDHTGEWAVVKGDDLVGTYATYEDALRAGYERCRLTGFLAKQILAAEPVMHSPWLAVDRLARVEAAIRGYYLARDNGEILLPAMCRAFAAIEDALGLRWVKRVNPMADDRTPNPETEPVYVVTRELGSPLTPLVQVCAILAAAASVMAWTGAPAPLVWLMGGTLAFVAANTAVMAVYLRQKA